MIVYDDLGAQVRPHWLHVCVHMLLRATGAGQSCEGASLLRAGATASSHLAAWQPASALTPLEPLWIAPQEAVARYAPPAAERIYVGKRGQRDSIKQGSIDEILVEHALQVSGDKGRLTDPATSTFDPATSTFPFWRLLQACSRPVRKQTELPALLRHWAPHSAHCCASPLPMERQPPSPTACPFAGQDRRAPERRLPCSLLPAAQRASSAGGGGHPGGSGARCLLRPGCPPGGRCGVQSCPCTLHPAPVECSACCAAPCTDWLEEQSWLHVPVPRQATPAAFSPPQAAAQRVSWPSLAPCRLPADAPRA